MAEQPGSQGIPLVPDLEPGLGPVGTMVEGSGAPAPVGHPTLRRVPRPGGWPGTVPTPPPRPQAEVQHQEDDATGLQRLPCLRLHGG